METTNQEPLLTTGQVASELGVCQMTINRLVRAGKLKCLKFNSRLFRFRRSDIDEFLKSKSTPPTTCGDYK